MPTNGRSREEDEGSAPKAAHRGSPRGGTTTARALRASMVAGLLGIAGTAAAQDCRLALVLALDVSSSVNNAEDRLQREGLAAALLAPEVVRAALAGDDVALYVFAWAGASSQAPLLPGWETIGSEEDLVRVAGAIRQARRPTFRYDGDGTAVGAALAHAAEAFAAGPDCRQSTVDVAGDGINNDGVEPRAVIEGAAFEGVTVNALIVDTPEGDPLLRARPGEGQLVGWFMQAVLHGPGAFHVLADGYEDYERAMTAKLLRELELPLVSGSAVAGGGA